jgi:hypothetical protein
VRRLLFFLLLSIASCSGVPSFPRPEPDHPECGDRASGRTCPSGQVCLNARCYASCAMTSECGPFETCSMGVCTRDTRPRDAGVDAGPPCADDCAGMLMVCRAATASCVQCGLMGMANCNDSQVCDIAIGSCIAPNPVQCAACDFDTDCDMAMGFECETRHYDGGDLERVCLKRCTSAADCSTGFLCPADGHCVPARNLSCFQVNAVAAGAGCEMDAQCAPAGSTVRDVIAGSCVGNICRQPCSLPGDCISGSCTGGICQ